MAKTTDMLLRWLTKKKKTCICQMTAPSTTPHYSSDENAQKPMRPMKHRGNIMPQNMIATHLMTSKTNLQLVKKGYPLMSSVYFIP